MDPRFVPGFRISTLDALVLIVGAAAAIGLARQVWWWGYVVAMVVGHFFLFCNVFRISRTLELAWAAVFVPLTVSTVTQGTHGWLTMTIVTLITTAVVVFLEMCRPSYHGVYWERINPNLKDWWEANCQKPTHGDG